METPRMRYLLILSLLALVPAAAQAQKAKEPGPVKVVDLKRTDAVAFEKEVWPIIKAKCITCHSGSVKEGNFDISSYEGIVKGGKRGSAIVPAKGADSLIYKVLLRTEMKPFMPPRGEDMPTPEEIALIKLWIDQ